jgi:hypothetical protein
MFIEFGTAAFYTALAVLSRPKAVEFDKIPFSQARNAKRPSLLPRSSANKKLPPSLE